MIPPVAAAHSDLQRPLKKGIHALEQLPSFYYKSNVHVKREVLGSIFPEKLTIAEKNVEPQESMKPFA